MPKLIIFDLDGTLVDTLPTIQKALNITGREYGMPYLSYDDVKRMIGNGAKKLVRRAMGELDDSLFEQVYATYDSTYAKTYLEVESAYEGIADMLVRLRSKGYILAVLSNKPDEFTRGIVEKLFGSDIFSFVSGGRATQPLKPDPTVPLAIAQQFGIALPDCLFVGDSEVDIRTARNAGMLSAVFDWGYGNQGAMAELLPDAILHAAADLEAFLERGYVDTKA